MKLSKVVDLAAIGLLLLLVLSGFMIMKGTAESNAITTEIVAHEAKKNKNKNLTIQIGLMTAELKNLQKDMDEIRKDLRELRQNEGN